MLKNAFRLYWENDSCSSQRTHYCRDHSQTLCQDWAFGLHKKCRWSEIPDSKSVIESFNAVKLMLTSVQENSKQLETNSSIRFDEELKIYAENLSNTDEKVRNLCMNHSLV